MTTRFREALGDHYPELIRAIDAIDSVVGDREVTVVEVLSRSDDETERIEEVLRAVALDASDAAGDFLSDAAVDKRRLGFRLFLAALSAFQLGLWLGQERLASIRLDDAKRRLAKR